MIAQHMKSAYHACIGHATRLKMRAQGRKAYRIARLDKLGFVNGDLHSLARSFRLDNFLCSRHIVALDLKIESDVKKDEVWLCGRDAQKDRSAS